MMLHYKVSIPDATIFKVMKNAHKIIKSSKREQYANCGIIAMN